MLIPVRYVSDREAAIARLVFRTLAGTPLELLIFDGGGITRTCVIWRRHRVTVSPLTVAGEA